jgi:RNA polymerase sigma-70 factor (ECF subfamily)
MRSIALRTPTASRPARRLGWALLAARLRFWRRARDGDAETQLVAAAKYGDPDAFDALVERYAPRLHAVARRMVGDDLAADVVQDALIAAFRGLRGYRGAASFSTYLHTIVINRCRRLGPKVQHHLMLREVESVSAGPVEVFEAGLTREQIEGAFRALPDPFREALGLREYSGLAYGEIAEVLGIQEGTVKSRIARGRRLLREALEREGVRP